MASTTSAESVARSLLEQAGVEIGGDQPWDIHVQDPRLYDRVLKDRELGLGEAYMDGWWDAERVDEFLVKVLLADVRETIRPSLASALLLMRASMTNRQAKRRARHNASAHYDIGNDLYERMLDRRMIYSCGYWHGQDSLDSAQEAKLDLICRKLGIEEGMSVLDIGCGWGGFAQYAASKYGAHVTGISPAVEQVKLATERCEGESVTILGADYREVTGTFDRIISVGMVEHVGPRNLSTFFDTCRERLAPDGMMLHHTIGSNVSKNVTDPFFDKYIFPGGVVPSLAQLSRGAHKHWAIEDVHNFGPDYDQTLLAWSSNIESRWNEIPSYDETFRRMWHYYLMASAASFRVRNLQLWQVVFTRSGRISPTYRAVR